MPARSKTYSLATWRAFGTVISSLASAAGRLPLTWPDGTATTLGQALVRASLSVTPASGAASKTSATCGQTGGVLSRSDALQRSLENRLRERIHGSPLCVVTWLPWNTPWGQCLSKPRASERYTSGTGTGLLPTLTATGNLLAPSMQKWKRHRRLYPTLTASDAKSGRMSDTARLARAAHPRGEKLSNLCGGTLNPTWCAWFMGYPAEWVACMPSETRFTRKSPPNS